ncbi:MAG: 50S ribosomal protein L21 [Nitrososphaeraceae archaeon]|jgi:large subunit ribosomal protein L21e
MPRSHGSKRKSRSILTKSNILRGISYLLINYKIGDKVIINIDPSEHNTMPHRRYQGKIGIIQEIGKRIIKVSIPLGNKEKILQTKRNHLKPLSN